jgi:UDP:flavonoid glycosyltransferase YjiC (YdhE family)
MGTVGVRLLVDRVALPELNRFRTALGLDPIRSVADWWSSPEKNVCLFPDWYAPKQPDWPPNTDLADFPLWDDRADEPLSADVQSFLDAGADPVVFTPGSANMYGNKFFQTAVEACVNAGRRGILLSRFSHHVPARLPPGIRHYSYVPLGKLLPRTAAIVHHGGIGTTAQALAAGVPQLIVAHAHDQFDNGARVTRLGVGSAIGRHQFRVAAVARRIGDLLQSPTIRASCQRVAGKLWARNGLDLAADRIEDFAAEMRGRHDFRRSESIP